jgi:membrane-associated phospholipid phosphatase
MLCKIQRLLAHAGRIAREWWATLACLALVAAAGCALILPHDRAWLARLITLEQPWHRMAAWLSQWGDYWTGTLIIVTVLWLAGAAFHRPRWRAAALACLLAASLGGLEADAVRFATGRPRPCTSLPDGLYGPHLSRNYFSFPSAHTTTAFATAGSLAVALPPVGVPLLLGAGGVGWSRLCLGQHHPSDVWAGLWLGLLNGVVLGFAARRWRGEEFKTCNTPAGGPSSRGRC